MDREIPNTQPQASSVPEVQGLEMASSLQGQGIQKRPSPSSGEKLSWVWERIFRETKAVFERAKERGRGPVTALALTLLPACAPLNRQTTPVVFEVGEVVCEAIENWRVRKACGDIVAAQRKAWEEAMRKQERAREEQQRALERERYERQRQLREIEWAMEALEREAEEVMREYARAYQRALADYEAGRVKEIVVPLPAGATLPSHYQIFRTANDIRQEFRALTPSERVGVMIYVLGQMDSRSHQCDPVRLQKVKEDSSIHPFYRLGAFHACIGVR